jgi:hypothetical protein
LASWLSVRIRTPKPLNVLRFNLSFLDVGSARVSVYVNESLVTVVDTSQVTIGSTSESEVDIPVLAIGEHRIAFRIDSLKTAESRATISNVTFGYRGTATCDLDIDRDGSVGSLRDGLLLMRSILGLLGSSVTVGLIDQSDVILRDSVVNSATNIALSGLLDIDRSGSTSPDSDGLMILRAMLGYKGDAITDGLIGANAQRNAQEIRTYMKEACGLTVD